VCAAGKSGTISEDGRGHAATAVIWGFKTHIDRKGLASMPLAEVLQVFRNIRERRPRGMQKDTEPSSNSIWTLIALECSLDEILAMIRPYTLQHLFAACEQRWFNIHNPG